MTKLPDSTMAVTIDLVFFIGASLYVLKLVVPATENNARSRPRADVQPHAGGLLDHVMARAIGGPEIFSGSDYQSFII
jgi:hypothetical protein